MKLITGFGWPFVLRILVVLVLGCACDCAHAAKLNASNWSIFRFNGPILPPSTLHIVATETNTAAVIPPRNVLTNLTDGNPTTGTTLTTRGFVIDLGQTCMVHRVFLSGTNRDLKLWSNTTQNQTNPPSGLIVVYVGQTAMTMNQVAEWTVPYDAGNPVDTEVDARFSPVVGRFVRLELQTGMSWGFQHWPGYAVTVPANSTSLAWNVGEVELYGFTGTNVQSGENAVVLPAGADDPLALAASELSYYLGELTGKPHPIITPQSTNLYSGTIYRIMDLKSFATNYAAMITNIAVGLLPDGVNVEQQGREVVFRAWPYRCVLWSVWEFLERQGVRWVYPEAHGDYVPTMGGVSTGMLPLRFTPTAKSIYANWDTAGLQPWPPWQKQAIRQGYLYPWRNRWTCSSAGYGPLGGAELPALPPTGITLDANYSEQFNGYPHNFSSVVPARILQQHTNWWGYSTNLQVRISPYSNSAPAFCMDNPALISWVAGKAIAVNKSYPIACTYPLNLAHFQNALNLLPLDATTYCECTNWCLPANGAWIANPVAWVCEYRSSFSGMYYNFVNEVAKSVKQSGSDALIGALAYADVFLPPAISNLSDNVQVEVCLYGAPTAPMNSLPNAGLKQALDTWRTKCSRLATYDYSLLHVDYWQQNPSMPVPLVGATVDRAKYLAQIGALNGGSQATPESLPYNPWNFYAYPRIRWNTNQTGDQLLHEFFQGYFREAAGPMFSYYKTLEDHALTNGADFHYRGYCYGITPGSFPLHVLAGMKTNLQSAEMISTNWETIQRVAKMRTGFDWVIFNTGLQGVNLSDVSGYPVITPTNGSATLDLTQMQAPTNNGANAAQLSGTNWTFWAGGLIRKTFNFTRSGSYQVVVSAKGATPDNEWPQMNVFLGASQASAAVTTTNYADYTFVLTIPAAVWDVTVTFNNAAPGGARNLTLNQIRVVPQ